MNSSKKFKKGTDDIIFTHFAVGNGKIKLDKNNEKIVLINKNNFKKLVSKLHPYVSENLEKILKI